MPDEPTTDSVIDDEAPGHGDDGPSPADARRGRSRTGLSVPMLVGSMVFSVAVGLLVAWLVIGPADDNSAVSVDRFVNGSSKAQVAVSGTATIGAPAPKAAFTYMEGTTGELSDLKGAPVVINFWSSSCAPCVREMPMLEQLHQDLIDKVAFLGIDVGDGLSDGERMVTTTGVTYPQARDPKSQIVAAFGGTALPDTVVLDATGKVVGIYNRALTDDDVTAIKKLVGAG